MLEWTVLIMCAVGVFVFGLTVNYFSYRRGQIDARNGYWRYELTKTPDGEERWKRVEP